MRLLEFILGGQIVARIKLLISSRLYWFNLL
jgi:hypothetical protein